MNTITDVKREVYPKQNANFFSAVTFLFTIPTFIKGYTKGFEENDLYQTLDEFQSEVLGNKIGKLWNNEIHKAQNAKREPSLIKVLIRGFGLEYFILAFWLCVVEVIIKPVQALILGRLILFYMPKDDSSHPTNLEAYLCAVGIILLTLAKILIFHPFIVNVQLVGLKVKIACCALIYRKALKLNNAAFSKTNVGQMVNLLSNDVGIFMRCALMLNYIWVGPLQCIVITYLMYREVGFSSIFGVLLLIVFIPMYYFLGKAASKYRLKVALRIDDRVSYMNEILSGIKVIKMYAWEKPIEYVLFSLRKLEMKDLRFSSYIKAIYLTFDILVIPIILYATIIAYVVHNDMRADKVFTLTIFYNSLRICMATFFPQGLGLLAETLISVNRIKKFVLNTEINFEDTKSCRDPMAVTISDGTAKWKSEVTLSNINLEIRRGCLVAIIGSVGCGKSSLLNVILRELPLINGEIRISGKISYACQEPWLFSGTVRDNILFGQEMDTERYNEVVRRCALECDFRALPYADHTLVGGRGSSLSGGQKARINLARAVYRDSDIYLLDDPLSAVDSRVGKQIFQDCIKDFLKHKTVVLVTHQIRYLSDVDKVIILDNGVIQSEDRWNDDSIMENKMNGEDAGLMTTYIIPRERAVEKVEQFQEVVKEQKSVGVVSKNVYQDYIGFGGNIAVITLILLLLLLTQVLLSGGAYFLTYWVNRVQIENMYEKQNYSSMNSTFSHMLDYQKHSKEMYIYIYTLITITYIIVSLARSYAFYTLCLKSSTNLHNQMFKNTISATMRFFNTNSQGRIINRFSQDMGIVDSQLPTIAIDTTQLLLSSVASILLIAIVNSWLIIPSIVIGTIMYMLKRFCLTTSRDIKRLEGVTRSPVFEHLSSSLQGLNTIRAFQAEKQLQKGFDSHQDLHSCCYHLFLTTSQGFGYFSDCVCFIYVIFVTLSFVVSDDEVLGGDVGLAITQCITLTGYLQWAIQQTAELENCMTCVERILEYGSIEQEPNTQKIARASWPENGEIIFRNISLKYSPEEPPILKNVSFKIGSKEKIGIVGRTGAGKSSVVNFIDTANLNLEELRSKITIIPQDPVLFSGTLRYNLDPFEEWKDSDLWVALEDVELKNAVAAFPLGLQTIMNQGGTNVSVGQRQLICLARAILRNNKILVLDEATASVDSETDALIQRTIRKKFKECTVLTVAHRIDTVMDSDKILVMSNGEVVEFDEPSVLLKNTNGHLYQLIHLYKPNN